jgi:hypothetical protein
MLAIIGGAPAEAAAVAQIVDALGFDPMVAGPLAEGVRFEPNTELFGANVAATEVRAMVDRFPDTPRGQLISRARSVELSAWSAPLARAGRAVSDCARMCRVLDGGET